MDDYSLDVCPWGPTWFEIIARRYANLEENKKVYVDMPLGFSQYDKNGKKMCLKLKKTLYGLRQSPRAFWKYITVKLQKVGLSR